MMPTCGCCLEVLETLWVHYVNGGIENFSGCSGDVYVDCDEGAGCHDDDYIGLCLDNYGTGHSHKNGWPTPCGTEGSNDLVRVDITTLSPEISTHLSALAEKWGATVTRNIDRNAAQVVGCGGTVLASVPM